jgi:hypothetical protein
MTTLEEVDYQPEQDNIETIGTEEVKSSSYLLI